jgi:hypothetical protein
MGKNKRDFKMNNSPIQDRLLSMACAFDDEDRKYAVRLLAEDIAKIENDNNKISREKDDALMMLGVYKLKSDEQKQRIKILEEALNESLALNINWSEEADVESLSYYSEYRSVIKEGKEALGKEI